MKTLVTTTAMLVLAAAPLALAQETHTHGHGESKIAIDADGALIELMIAADDIVGFERAPETDAEKKAVADAIATLEAKDLFMFDDAAGCEADHLHVEFEVEGEHAEFHVEHEFECADAGAIASIKTSFFASFPGTEELDVELSDADGARAIEWESDQDTLPLK